MNAVEPAPSLNPGATMARARKEKKSRGHVAKPRWTLKAALAELGQRPSVDKPTDALVEKATLEALAVAGLPAKAAAENLPTMRIWLRRRWRLHADILPAMRLHLGKGPKKRALTSLAAFQKPIARKVASDAAALKGMNDRQRAELHRAWVATFPEVAAAQASADIELATAQSAWDRRYAAVMAKGAKQRGAADAAKLRKMPEEYRANALHQEIAHETVEHRVRAGVRTDAAGNVYNETIGVTRRRKFDAETAMDWTPDQAESAEQIRAAWATIVSEVAVRGMSYAEERVDASYRPPAAPPDAITNDSSTHYNTWKEMCAVLDIDVAAVLAVAAEGFTARTVDRARNRRNGWASEQTRRGLDVWRPARRNMRLWVDRPKRAQTLRAWLSTIVMIEALPRRGSILIVHGQARRAAVRRMIIDLRGDETARAVNVIVVPDLDAAGFLVGCVMPTVVDCAYEGAAPPTLFRMVSELAATCNASAAVIRHARVGKRRG